MGNDKTLVEQGPLPQTAGDIIASGGTIQKIQTVYHTAVSVQKPRELKEIVNKCITEAELAADLFYYRWPTSSKDKKTGEIKKSFVLGPSIHLALAAVRNFGNIVVQQRPVLETHNSWIFTAAVIDLETGFTLERQFRMDKKFPVYGKMDPYRKDDIRFQIGQSKAIRNAVVNTMPAGLTDKMIKYAVESVRSQIQKRIDNAGGDILQIIGQVLLKFDKFCVTQDMIEEKIGLKVDKWDIETLTMLAGDLKALESGAEATSTLYAEDEPDDNEKPETEGLSEKDMSPGDPADHQDVKPETKKNPKKDSDEKPAEQGDLTAGF